MSPARLIIDTRERVYQHIKDSPDGLTEEGILRAMKAGECRSCGGTMRKAYTLCERRMLFGWHDAWPETVRLGGCGDEVPTLDRPCPDCPLAPWLVHACLGYLLAEARIIDTSDDATEYRWVVLGV